MPLRIGLGHDTHRLEPGRPLWLGGIEVPHELGCIAHSDGDVLLHAITDAILGALAWGDIGEWFPDTDAAWKDARSADLLQQVLTKVRAAGWSVNNVDAVIFAQRPKLVPYKPAIRSQVAAILELPLDCVSVKAKTGERVGPVGREEAISAEVVTLLTRN